MEYGTGYLKTFFEYHAVYDVMWKNTAELDRLQIRI